MNMTMSGKATILDYMRDSYKFQAQATVMELHKSEDGKTHLILDRTIFYPQGGGQPFDTGTIKSEGSSFVVNEVRMDEGGVVHHIGEVIEGSFVPGQTVNLQVNEERRRFNCRLHSAGHLIDVAVQKAGLKLTPTKGYHFVDSPYVEYQGDIPAENRDYVLKSIQDGLNKLLSAPSAVRMQLPAPHAENDPIYYSTTRVIAMADDEGCPCGGTHVQNTTDIGAVEITKIKAKGGNTRISYKLA